MKHGCVCGVWELTGLGVIPRDDWRLAYVSAGVDDIHGEMGDSWPTDEK
jgi:hypothetical protein